MRIHYLQHVPFENPGNIIKWASQKEHILTKTLLYNNEKLPDINNFDMLVVMGGPMNIYEENEYPFLTDEKSFIKKSIKADKIILGICLGAQLLAESLGAEVVQNNEKEIGWFDITMTDEAKKSKLFLNFPSKSTVFHWHGDRFKIPKKAYNIASSEACCNQGFVYKKIIGLQFHIESTIESVKKLIKNCENEIIKSKYIQSKEEMIKNKNYFNNIEKYLNILLNNIEKIFYNEV